MERRQFVSLSFSLLYLAMVAGTGNKQQLYQQLKPHMSWIDEHSTELKQPYYSVKHTEKSFKNSLNTRGKRAVTAEVEKLWPGATIPYLIDQVLEEDTKKLIWSAMEHWHNNTCLKFVDHTKEADYVLFTKENCGCCSSVGRTGGLQTVSLKGGCVSLGVIIHELGHVIGFWHEHTRPDRDKHIQVRWDNIAENRYVNFQKRTDSEINSLGRPYDAHSIMHYGPRTFSQNSKDTITSKNGMRLRKPGKTLSPEDIIQAQLLYNCQLPSCDRMIEGYGNGRISSPQHPKSYLPSRNCTWSLMVPEDSFVRVTFESFSVQDSYHCSADKLEIRQYDRTGPLIGQFCGEGKPPDITSTVSLWIELTTDHRVQKKGFSARYVIREIAKRDRVRLRLNSGSSSPVRLQDDGCVRVARDRTGYYTSPYVPTGSLTSPIYCSITIEGGANVKRIGLTMDTDQARAYGGNCLGNIFKSQRHSQDIIGLFESSGDNDVDAFDSDNWMPVNYICGLNPDNRLRIASNRVIVVWNSSKHKSLKLNYTIDYDECEQNNNNCEHNCVNTLDGFTCTCKPGYHLRQGHLCHAKVTRIRDRCGVTFNSVSGKILSSTEPARECAYYIELPGFKIHMRFTKIRMRYSNNCTTNYIEISTSKAAPKKICNNNDLSRVVASNHITITRYMDDSNWMVPHFIAEYSATRKQEEKCQSSLTEPGSFSSPGFPNEYPAHITCIWKLSGSHWQRIQLEFTMLDIENTQNCAFDRLTLYDGRTRSSPLLATICGNLSQQTTYISTGKQMTVVFTSDQSGQGRGFQASFSYIETPLF